MAKGVLIPTTGKVREISYETADELHEMVGGYFEAVKMEGGGAIFWLNEDGKREGLPVNHRASRLAAIDPADYIVGPVVVTGPSDRQGDETDLPDTIAARLLALA